VTTETNIEENSCRLHLFERNQYFYGKLMTVRIFETEQRYFNEKSISSIVPSLAIA
jgi:hypothetical protein